MFSKPFIMKYRLTITILLILSLAVGISAHGEQMNPATPSLPADSTARVITKANYGGRQSVGLVLSGGGAKGIAHIGVIKALEDNEIPIDYIAGTSMGAVVGGLYAAGYTPEEMMALILSKGFADWSTGTINPKLSYYYSEPSKNPDMVKIAVGGGDASTSILPTSLINPLPMNFAFMELFSTYAAQCKGDFNRLFVPFRCVTSDVYAKHKIVCRGGSLGDAVRASMSFPLVFHPIEMDSVLVYDGGIYDNFPVDVMRTDFAPDIMIGVDVSNPDTKPKSNDVIQQLEDMIIQNNDYSLPADEGIRLKINLQEFSLLDFPKAREIYRIGYDHAMAMMDSIRHRVTSRIPAETTRLRRSVFKSETPYLRFDSVTVTGGTPSQNRYLRQLFLPHNSDTFGIENARDAYYRAITPGLLRNLLPQAVAEGPDDLFTLRLKATVKEPWRLGLGGYISSSTSSYLFLSVGYKTLSYNSMSFNLNGWIGQNCLAGCLDARAFFNTPIPSYIRMEGVLSRRKYAENDHVFFKDNLPTFVTHNEGFGRLYYGIAAGRRGKAEIGFGGGRIGDQFYATDISDYAKGERAKSVRCLGQGVIRYQYETLNDLIYPVRGAEYKINAMGVYGKSKYSSETYDGELMPEHGHRKWLQLEASTRNYFTLGQYFSLGLEWSMLASTRKLYSSYDRSLVEAPTFNPTPSSYNAFNTAFRANSFTTAGVVPVLRFNETLQLRANAQLFLPFRSIERDISGEAAYGKWFSDPEFFGELAIAASFPFATVSAYGNYMTAYGGHWNFGLSLGLFFIAPRLLR